MILLLNKELLSIPLDIQKFKKEFWDKFSDYKNQIEEEWVKDKYVFVNSNEKINDVLNNFKNKLGNELYEKYIEEINGNIIRIKSNNLLNLLKADIKLINFNFYYYFQPVYEITIPNDKCIDQHIKKLAKKYSINFDFKLLNSDQFSENKKIIQFFSLKNNQISLLQDFDNKRLKRVYYVRFKLNCLKTFNWESIKSKLKLFLTDELKLEEIPDHHHYYSNHKKTLTVKVYDKFWIGNDKTEKILNVEHSWFNDWFWKDKTKCETFLEYKMNLQEEKEQILIKTLNTNYWLRKQFFLTGWIDKFNRKIMKASKKKQKSNKDNPNSNDFVEINKSIMHKIIIVTNNSTKLEQLLKERIFNFIGSDNIFNFDEKIYLSKSSFWNFPEEKHSFQFITKNSFLAIDENLKKLKDLIIEYQHSYDRYKFDNKIKNRFEYKIMPISPLEDWDESINEYYIKVKKAKEELESMDKYIECFIH